MTDWPSLIDEIIVAGIRKAELARLLGITRMRLQHWHDGTVNPKEPYGAKLKALRRTYCSQQIRTYEAAIVSTSTSIFTA